MKFYLIIEIIAAILLVILVMMDSAYKRALLMIAVLVLFHAAIVVFGIEYDKMQTKQWKKKEERLKEEYTKKTKKI